MERVLDLSGHTAKLSEILHCIRSAAPNYESRMAVATQVINELAKLRSEEELLTERISAEQRFSETSERILAKAERARSQAQIRLSEVQSELRALILTEAAFAASTNTRPLIMKFRGLKGNTPFVDRIRMKAKEIELLSRLKRKSDLLQKLRQNVFCLELGDTFPDLLPSEIEESPYADDFEAAIKDLAIQSSETIIAPQLAPILKRNITPKQPEPEIPFSVVQFAKPKDFPDFDYSILDLDLSKAKKKKEAVQEVFNAILNEENRRYELIEQIRMNCSPLIDQLKNSNFLLCSDLVDHVRNRIEGAQKVVDQLVKSQNNAIPFDVWANEKLIHEKMRFLEIEMDKLFEQIGSQKVKRLKSIGYRKVSGDVVVDEVSRDQIDGCLLLIRELEAAMSDAVKRNTEIVEEIGGFLSDFEELKKSRKIEEVVDLSSSADELAETKELYDLRDSIINRQLEDIKKLSEVIREIPESAAKHRGAVEEWSVEIPCIRLPPLISPFSEEVLEEARNSNSAELEEILSRRLDLYVEEDSVVSAPRRRKKNPLGGLLEEWKRRLRGSAEVVNAENSLKEVEARNSELVKSVKTLRLRKSMVARLKSELEQVDRELEVFGV